MTQTELAERLSAPLGATLNATAITKIEKGQRAVRLNEAVAAADVLGVPLTMMVAVGDEAGTRLVELRRERDWYNQRSEEALRKHAEAQQHCTRVEDAIRELEHQDQVAESAEIKIDLV